MLSIFDNERDPTIEQLIADEEACVNYLEPLYQQGLLTPYYTFILALQLFHLHDNDTAFEVLASLLSGQYGCIAAIWSMHIYEVTPSNNTFAATLKQCSDSAEAWYMRASYLEYEKAFDHRTFLAMIDTSLSYEWYPHNIATKLRADYDLSRDERQIWFDRWQSLIVQIYDESHVPSEPTTSDALYTACWNEYIRGTHITQIVWESNMQRLKAIVEAVPNKL